MTHTLDKDKFRIQVYTAEEFYNLYDNPTDNFRELVEADKAYFQPTSDLYDGTRKDKHAMHVVVFTKDTNTAIPHVGFQFFPTIIYIFHVFTLEQYRRQGLVKHTLTTIQKQGKMLGLRVDPVNTAAITLYEQLEFQQGYTGIQTTDDDTDIEYIWQKET